MTTSAPPGIRRELPLTSGSSITDTAGGRAFYQERLSMLGLCIFVLSGSFQLVSSLVVLLMFREQIPLFSDQGPLGTPALLQLAATGVGGALWLLNRTTTLPGQWLSPLDSIGTLAMCIFFDASAAAQEDWIPGMFVMTLTTLCVLVTRAIVVPSSARRTLIVSIPCSLPPALLTTWQALRHGAGLDVSIGNGVGFFMWGVVIVTISTVASRTIFGLRREVGHARVLGQYTLEEKIGEGGMGEVWRASHAMLRRPTAIKLLRQACMSEASLKRFEREVQHTALLTHPNTVAIYDYGRTPEGVFYYAMEFLDGIDLERLVGEEGPLPPERVVHVLRSVCGALAEAHDIGLVHRDIKPANILLAPRAGETDVAKVVDFGLVKDLGAEEISLTGTNVLTGTPLYLSPEAIRAPDGLDGRSDLYALGAVGWFLLAGRPPFVAQTIVEIASHHLHSTPERPSKDLGRALPADLENLLLSCLQKNPDLRPANARAMRAALDACQCAGGWTAERSTAWWSTFHGRSRPRIPTRGMRTMAIDLGNRIAD
jgi:eukaryotic-like serine/threonine-protein kinase